jgi:hypothetical protein
MGFFEAITAAMVAIPKAIDLFSSLILEITKLIDETKRANQMKQIELEQKEIMRTGNTKALEARFKSGVW